MIDILKKLGLAILSDSEPGSVQYWLTKMCPCLKPLDDLLKKRGYKESFRGQAWSQMPRMGLLPRYFRSAVRANAARFRRR